mgnify:CR=1 FL=1
MDWALPKPAAEGSRGAVAAAQPPDRFAALRAAHPPSAPADALRDLARRVAELDRAVPGFRASEYLYQFVPKAPDDTAVRYEWLCYCASWGFFMEELYGPTHQEFVNAETVAQSGGRGCLGAKHKRTDLTVLWFRNEGRVEPPNAHKPGGEKLQKHIAATSDMWCSDYMKTTGGRWHKNHPPASVQPRFGPEADRSMRLLLEVPAGFPGSKQS